MDIKKLKIKGRERNWYIYDNNKLIKTVNTSYVEIDVSQYAYIMPKPSTGVSDSCRYMFIE